MPQAKPTNPFYLVLLVVGAVFAVTACAYCVMMVRGLNPRLADEEGLMGLMSQHGLVIMVVELVLLGLLTVAAIATDGYWTGEGKSGDWNREPRTVGREGETREGEAPAEPMVAGDRR